MKNTKYVSEETIFLKSLLSKPETQASQQKMRSTWWDKGFVDQNEQETYAASEVKHDGYTYFSYTGNKAK